MTQTYPFQNLVFEGGGVKGITYIGVLQVLDERHVLQQIRRVAGASAGAITAMLVSFGLDAQRTIDLLNTLDYSRIPQVFNDQEPSWLKLLPEDIRDDVAGAYRLVRHYGWFSSAYFYDWLQETIAGQCNGEALATFADFQARGFHDLYVVATDISTQSTTVYSAAQHPTVPVADAVRMSMSIPLFFEALAFEGTGFGSGDVYADGGTVLNYPIHLFDDPATAPADSRLYLNGTSFETLGCYLMTPPSCPQHRKPIQNIATYIENLFETLLQGQKIGFLHDREAQARSIQISDDCVAATDFNIKPHDAIYNALVDNGRSAAEAYLDSYRTRLAPFFPQGLPF